jgi:hypothetical protein
MKEQKQKSYYDVKIEALVPCILTYRILAEDESAALDAAIKTPPNHIKPNGRARSFIKATVYNAGSMVIKLTKAFK